MCQRNAAGGTLTFTFTGLSGSVRVWIGNAGAAVTDGNGTARGTNVGNGESWVTLSGDISDYNGSIVITPASDAPSLRAVEVAGKMLVDSGVTAPNVPSIASTVRANPSAGFSIVTYTGTGSNATIAHGLNAVPKLYITKRRDGANDWETYHGALGATYYGKLNANDQFTTSGGTSRWNDTEPTSSVFSVGTSANCNGSGNTYVAYCFAPVAGYSSFGSFNPNGTTDNSFVYTGFRPKFIILKYLSLIHI